MGLRFSIFGDSISTFQGWVPAENHVCYRDELLRITGVERVEETWWMQVIRCFDGKLLANASFSGSMVEGAGFPAASSPERIAQLAGLSAAGGGVPGVGAECGAGANAHGLRVEGGTFEVSAELKGIGAKQTTTVGGGLLEADARLSPTRIPAPQRTGDGALEVDAAPDAILVFMGINDYGWGGAAAQAAGRSAATPPCLDLDEVPEAVAGEAGPYALAGFESAYGLMLDRMRAAYPQAEVWCMTLVPGRDRSKGHAAFAYALRGVDFDAYNGAIRAQAAAHGYKVADLRAFGYDYEASDGTHPTKRGMLQIAAMTIAAMEGCSASDVSTLEGVARRIASSSADGAGLPTCFEGRRGQGLFADHAAFSDAGSNPSGACMRKSSARTSAAADTSPALFPELMRSQRWCYEPKCVGCPHARGTGNQWSCVCDKP